MKQRCDLIGRLFELDIALSGVVVAWHQFNASSGYDVILLQSLPLLQCSFYSVFLFTPTLSHVSGPESVLGETDLRKVDSFTSTPFVPF